MSISFENVSFQYSKAKSKVLTDFSYTFQPGINIIKGFSGCGKSTLLKLASGLLTPNTGTIKTSSQNTLGSPRFLRYDSAFVFQGLNLLPLASVSRNIELARQLTQVSEKLPASALKFLGIDHLLAASPEQLSGGQQQRVAIARMLLKKALLNYLDEPTSGLDNANTHIIMKALLEQKNSKAVYLISTHDERVLEYANQILDFNQFLPVEKHLEQVG